MSGPRAHRRVLSCGVYAGLLLWSVVAGCADPGDRGGSGGAPAATAQGPNLILISIDTLRADRLEAYGYARDTSPFLAELARRGALFEHVIAECSWTLPSHATLFTAQPPEVHGIDLPSRRLSAGTPLLTRSLQDAGYRTMAVTEGGYVDDTHGFDHGFEAFDDSASSLTQGIERSLDLLDRADPRPFFLFLHTFEVHCPYDPAPEYVERFLSPGASDLDTRDRCGQNYYNSNELSAADVQAISDHYDAGIRAADDLLRMLFEELRGRELLAKTLIAITSDHGEELGEYGRIGHERTLHLESLRVPLILVGPDVPAGRHPQAAGLADVAPTLLELLGLPPLAGARGRSLVPALHGNADAGAPRRSELAWKRRLVSLWTPQHFGVQDRAGGTVEIYRLEDAGPRPIDGRTPEAQQFVHALDAAAATAARPAAEAAPKPSAEDRERLRALGYSDSGEEPR